MKLHWILGVVVMAMFCEAKDILSDSERILERRPLGLQSVDLSFWRITYPNLLKVESGGIRGAHATLKFHEDHGGLCRDFFPYIYGKNPMLNGCRLYLNLKPEVYNQYNQLSLMIYPDRDNRASVWFDMGGSGLWTQACWPLKPRQWNRISICWSHHTPEQARKLKYMALSRQCFGRLPGDPRWSCYYIKDLVLEKVAVGTEDSWQVSPEKIIVPQIGFSPGSRKRALLHSSCNGKNFYLEKNGKKCHVGKIRTERYPTGEFKIADFSDFRIPGIYRVRCGRLLSVPFQISENFMQGLADKNASFLFNMRSGMKTDVHPACFLDDCIRSDNAKPVNVSGGWFDASDLRGYHSMAMKTILRPVAMGCHYNLKNWYKEAHWGARQLVKLFDKETGLPFTVHSLYPRNNPDKEKQKVFTSGHFYKVNNYWTDNKPGTGDERVIHFAKGTYICPPDLLDSHWGLTAAGFYFKTIAKKQDQALADQILKLCKRHFDYITDSSFSELKKNGIGYYNPSRNVSISLKLENMMTLWKITGKTFYREMARTLARELLKRQQRKVFKNTSGYLTGYFRSSEKSDSAKIAGDDMSMMALIRLVGMLEPDDDLFFEIQAALRLYADFFAKNPMTYNQPYYLPYFQYGNEKKENFYQAEVGTSLTDDQCRLYGSLFRSFSSGLVGNLSMQTQALAILLNDLELQEIAASYLYFHIGDNPYGRGFIANIGTNYRKDIMSSALGWIPGMMSNPLIVNGIPTLPYHRHYGCNEIYTQTQTMYGVAASMIAAPAKITLEGVNLPPNMRITIQNQLTGKKLLCGAALKARQTFELPGGAAYDFIFSSGQKMEVPVVSGEILNLSLDFENTILLQKIDMPGSSKPSSTAKINVWVRNFGNKVQNVKLLARTENLFLEKTSVTGSIAPGECAAFAFSGKFPAHAGVPCVFMVYPDGQRAKVKSAAAVTVQ